MMRIMKGHLNIQIKTSSEGEMERSEHLKFFMLVFLRIK